MRAILFRKLEVDGVNYYQLFNAIEDFEPDDDFTDFLHRSEKEYFYVDAEGDVDIPDASLLNIYYDSPEGFTNVLDSNLFLKVFNAFVEKYHIVIKEIKSIDEVVKDVGEKIMFQDDVIAYITQRIYMNQSFVTSDLPIELKQCQKTNILFHGMSGSGKKTIVKCLQKELNVPYADIVLNGNVRDTLEIIIKTLLERSHNPEEASCGVVYIRDNYQELADALGDYESVFKMIKFLTSQGRISYEGKKIDFRTVTFVVLFDDDNNEISYSEAQNIIGCELDLSTRTLTNEEKYQVLFSPNGSITHYEKFLNHYGNKFIVDDKCLMNLIEKCSRINPSMDTINKIINAIVSYCTFNGINDVVIDNENMEIINAFIDQQLGDKTEKEESKEKIEKYLFEKRVDMVFNEAKRYVIGQDKNLRLLITDILSNLSVASEKNLYSPESYKQNILIRGCTGSGKTFMVKTVCKILDVPYTAADSTKYTETGYVGASIEDLFVSLYRAAGNDLEKAQRGIVFLDEIDKKTDGSSDRGGPTRKAVLHELLKPTEGTVLRLNVGNAVNPSYINFDTSRVTFVCAGAFEGIEKLRDDRVGKNKIGFDKPNAKKANPEIITDDYISYGMPEEFMGRVKSFIDLDNVDVKTMVDIMKKRIKSITN